MQKKPVAVVCGTRPEIIKMAPVVHALAKSETLRPVLIHSGQHTDLAWPMYEFFGLTVDQSVDLKREGAPTLANLSAELLTKLSGALEQAQPAAVLVHGDTSTAAMAALAAFYQQVPVGHVEAGLRTYDMYSPFPEEMNRNLIGRMAAWHFTPTQRATEALAREGIEGHKLVATGNTVIDAAYLTEALWKAGSVSDTFIQGTLAPKLCPSEHLVLVTAHRRENWGEGLRNISNAVADLLEEDPLAKVVWPLHANPAVAQEVRTALAGRAVDESRIFLTAPLDYPALVWLLQHAWLVLTDSGGIQEEAAAFSCPVLVLRESTERPELIESGGGLLVGANRARITEAVRELRDNPESLERMRTCGNPFGDGTAGQQIVQHLERALLA